jgi:hypothetical protein
VPTCLQRFRRGVMRRERLGALCRGKCFVQQTADTEIRERRLEVRWLAVTLTAGATHPIDCHPRT